MKCAFVYLPTLTPLQSVDNYFVYVISDLISTFADSAEYLRYGETVSTWSRLKQKRAFISRHAQTQFIHAIYELCSGLNFDVVMLNVYNTLKRITITVFGMQNKAAAS